MPSEYDEQIRSNWQNAGRTKLTPATELPELDESSMTDNKSFSRGGSGGGGGFGNRDRNGGKSSRKNQLIVNSEKSHYSLWIDRWMLQMRQRWSQVIRMS